MSTIIIWFRNDLRTNDHPALASAIKDADQVIPLFILNQHLLKGKSSSSNRNHYLLEALRDLKKSLKTIHGDLVVRNGDTITELSKLSQQYNVKSIYYTEDYTPLSRSIENKILQSDQLKNIVKKSFPGRLIIDNLDLARTKTDKIYQVFTPFYNNWLNIPRRQILTTPTNMNLPKNIQVSDLPTESQLIDLKYLSKNLIKGGEVQANLRLNYFLNNNIDHYHINNNDLSADKSSRLSADLHFGCLSPLQIENLLSKKNNEPGVKAWHRQLAWREFYNYILFYYPTNIDQSFQSRYQNLSWQNSPLLWQAWLNSQTGFPIVDAALNQLKLEGFMHNRARLIVGSFLTKDLEIDWRIGQRYFMKWLIDGDSANNNGNWQWIASTGVDPAPIFRRLYNPTKQQLTYDPLGNYVKKYLPVLKNVPIEYLSEPSKMPLIIQQKSSCIIGLDYPRPIVDHSIARQKSLARYSNIMSKEN